MPRIRQNAQRYASEDFLREIRQKQGFHNLMSQRALSGACGIPRSTLSARLASPETLTVEDLRKLVGTIAPDPLIVLALLGYDRQALKKVRATLDEAV